MNKQRLKVVGLGGLGLIVLLLIGVAIWVTLLIRRPFPDVNGRQRVAGINAEVEIYRDDNGIPQIYAESLEDLFFAQGYTHAQDRFWQMEFWRYTGQGRLAEIAGEPLVESDRFIRTMGWNRIAEETAAYYREEEPEYYSFLEAYSAGVNAYIDDNRNNLSVNASILRLVNEPWEIEPWEPVHTVAWGVVMAYDLSGGQMRNELARVALVQELGEAELETLLPGYPYANRPVMVPTDAMEFLDEFELEEESESLLPPIDWHALSTDLIGAEPPNGFAFGSGDFVGSNNWVVSGEHTASGLPILANDPHLGIQMPSIWYEIGLHGPDFDVVGFSFAGVPGVIIGHNERIAWGVTNVNPDVIDLYIEKVNPNNPDQYEFMGEWREMTIIEEVIEVNGGDPVTLEVRETHHGPIINEVVGDSADVLALRWTAQESSRILQSVILLNQAEDWDDFRAALAFWDIPSQNVVYADIDGNIGYQLPGLIPQRPAGDGQMPVPGWTGEYEWGDWVPYDALPRLYNPESGYIVTANHAAVDLDYPFYIANRWADGDRGQRIVDLVVAAIERGDVTLDDMAAAQFDSYSLMADSWVPLFADLSSDDPEVQAAIERIRGWDRQLLRDSVPAGLFEVWYNFFANATFSDEVSDQNLGRVRNSILMHALADQPNAVYWDDVTTNDVETREDMMLLALAETIAFFEERVGDDPNEWTWGSIHTATFVSNPLGQSGIGPIENMVNRGPFPVDGGRSTVNANGYSTGNLAAVTGMPSMRMLIDMADLDNMRAINPTGQSGHPGHRHYDDMIQLWADGQYLPLPWDRERIESEAADRLILVPDNE